MAASEVLRAVGVRAAPGEDALRRVRVLRLLKSGLPLEHFALELLRITLGWDEAFAQTISDLEAAGLTHEDVDAAAEGDRTAGRRRRLAGTRRVGRRLLEPCAHPGRSARARARAGALGRIRAPCSPRRAPGSRPRRRAFCARSLGGDRSLRRPRARPALPAELRLIFLGG